MTDIAIRVEDLSKQYRIGVKREYYKTLRDSLSNAAAAPLRRLGSVFRRPAARPERSDDHIWALKNLSFEVKRGEVVGIIGRNGAGKSTLLKVLSRITEPTKGRAEIHGRVGSLLEVGTGFHPELTGRENIFLNGAILGMRRAEIERKLEDIVSFAEMEKFIETPVKRYSSGMYMRLAFAVAAHLEPEILVVDEVLAVGDMSFQKKCLNKMQDVGQQGRTVLFVSHNMPAITRLCERAIMLHDGGVLVDGPAYQVAGTYLNYGLGTMAAREWPEPAKAPGNEIARLRAVRVRDQCGRVSDALDIRKPINVEMEYTVLEPGNVLSLHFEFHNEAGIAFGTLDLNPEWRGCPRPAGTYVSRVHIPGNFLTEGTMLVDAWLGNSDPHIPFCRIPDAVAFQVIDSLDGDTARGDYAGPFPGAVRPILDWSTQYRPDGQSPAIVLETGTASTLLPDESECEAVIGGD
jgi:lipopolysaccharide transport system ATP-binding protein